MRHRVGEELIQNDQKPRPLVIRQAPLVRELDGKGLKPGELRGLGTQRDRGSLHRRLLISLPSASRCRVSRRLRSTREKELVGRKKFGLVLCLAAALLITAAGVLARAKIRQSPQN